MSAFDTRLPRSRREPFKWVGLLFVGVLCASSSGSGCQKKPAPPEVAPENQTYPSAVYLTVRGAPTGAEVWYEGESLGPASRPVSLPYTVSPLEVTVVAAGYESVTVSVVPDRAREVAVTLKRAVGGTPTPPVPPPPSVPPAPSVPPGRP